MIDYNKLKNFNTAVKKDLIIAEKEKKENFKILHSQIFKRIDAFLKDFIESDDFDEYVENCIKTAIIQDGSTTKTKYYIPFSINCDIDLDYQGSFGLSNPEADFDNISSLDNLIECDKNVDLFDLYYHLDGCEKLEDIASHTRNIIKEGLINNKMTVHEASWECYGWPYDYQVVYKIIVPFTVDLS